VILADGRTAGDFLAQRIAELGSQNKTG